MRSRHTMRTTPHALTGAAAAAMYDLDGFRDGTWPLRWCTPRSGRWTNDAIRTDRWETSSTSTDLLVATPRLLLRHLGEWLEDLAIATDPVRPLERIELAVEHAVRLGLVSPTDLLVRGSSRSGDRVLREIVRWRADQPPTESYAETRADQRFREFGWRCWRQVPIYGPRGETFNRVDFVYPYGRPRARPELFRPGHGLIIEIDSEEYHAAAFERDHRRQSTYDRLGYRWVSFTPRQIEHQSALVRRTVEGVLGTLSPFVRRRAG